MSDRNPSPAGGPLVEGPRDPEHDATASYALEPEYAESLTRRLLATTGQTVEVRSPLNGAPLAHIPQSSADDVAQAFARARKAQQAWSRVSLDDRAETLLRLHDLILDRQDEIIDLIVLESGKARKHAFDEPPHVALTARYYARTAHDHLDTQRKLGVVPGLTRVEVNRVPKGVVGIISPWNYPFTMALCDGLPALLAGNAVVAKPDAQTMLSALLGAQLLEEAGFPPDLWTVVAGPGSEIGPEMVGRADYICFTGSTATGRLIAKGCAERLIGCSLELGGKNPLLVLRDADLEKAAEGAVRASFSNAGQLCVSMERMFVADQVYDRFVERFVSRTEAMTLGASLEWGVDMGSLISQDQLDTVVRHVEDAVAKGARVLTGGKARPDLGPYFFEPTILEGVTPEMTCFGEETFGPVISLYRFHDEADAVARANAGEYGLNASIYSQDGARARAIARLIKCGTVNINEAFGATFAQHRQPDGRHARVRDGPAPGQRGRPPLHRVAVGRDPAADPVRADARDVRRDLRQGDDRQPEADEEAGPGMTSQEFDFDVLVVGSGFGGSVTALRLTEKGYRVGVLEAGARFEDEDFASGTCRPEEVPVGARARDVRHPAHRRRPRHDDRGRRGRRRRLAGLREHALRAAAGVLQRPAVVAHHRLEGRARAVLRPGQADARRRREPGPHAVRRGDGEGRERHGRGGHLPPDAGRRLLRRPRPGAGGVGRPTRTSAAPARPATPASTAASA